MQSLLPRRGVHFILRPVDSFGVGNELDGLLVPLLSILVDVIRLLHHFFVWFAVHWRICGWVVP